MGTEFLNHKRAPPPRLIGAINRTHLLDAVIESPRYRVIFVQAPAGHGKTTLLRQIMGVNVAAGAAVGWISLDEGDDDSTRFVTRFLELIERLSRIQAAPEVAGDWRAPVRETLGEVDDVLQGLSASAQPLALFIDEFQVIRSDVILSFIARLISRLPPHVTICFGSRSLPEIGLGRMVMRGEALLLKTRDMRFTRDETEAFFGGSLDSVADKALLDDLFVRTEGWPAALQLARLALRGGADKRLVELLGFSNEPEFEEYLADNVLAAQSGTVREFLLCTSVLPRFSPELCREMSGREDSAAIIRRLELDGLFVAPVNADRTWFRYHSLFSSYLRKQLEVRRPEEPGALSARAARWFAVNGLPEEAMQCAVEARDFAFAADVLEQWSEQLIREGLLATIERWLDQLPISEIRERPGLQMKVLWALLFLRRFHRARPLLDALIRAIEQNQAAFARAQTMPLLVAVRHLMEDDIVAAGTGLIDIDVDREAADEFESFELGAIANIQSLYLRTRGDFVGAQNKAVIGSAHSETGHAAFSGAYAMAFLGNAYLAQGRLQDALEAYRRGFETARRLRGSYASAVAVACYGEAMYYADSLDEARALLEDSLPRISDACMPDALTVAHITLSKILVIQDSGVDAEYVLREAEKLGRASGLPRVVRLVNWARVRQMIARDDLEDARDLANHILSQPRISRTGHVFHAEEIDCEEIGLLRLLLHERNLTGARILIDSLRMEPAFTRRPLRALRMLMLEAVERELAGHPEEAKAAVSAVLDRASPERLSRFLKEEPSFFSLLERSARIIDKANDGDVIASRLRAGFGALFPEHSAWPSANPENIVVILDTLTAREADILAMLSRGISNRDIGASLFVSTNTVKHHLRNIYSKLGVRNRTEATNFALRHGLVR